MERSDCSDNCTEFNSFTTTRKAGLFNKSELAKPVFLIIFHAPAAAGGYENSYLCQQQTIYAKEWPLFTTATSRSSLIASIARQVTSVRSCRRPFAASR